jgi:hypothetical protein
MLWLHAAKQISKALLQTLGDLFDIHQGYIPDAALDAAIVRSVQSASLRSLFLVDVLVLPYSADCPAKPDANIERHRV